MTLQSWLDSQWFTFVDESGNIVRFNANGEVCSLQKSQDKGASTVQTLSGENNGSRCSCSVRNNSDDAGQ